MADVMNLLCWEGYESDNILGEFARQHKIQTRAQTLLSDADTAKALAGVEHTQWDVLNINNPWVRDYLCHRGVVKNLSEERFAYTLDNLLPEFDRLSHWARDDVGNLVGVCQRFGAFNLVVHTDRVDRHAAEDQGFNLANDQGRKFGILTYDDFNIFHICIAQMGDPRVFELFSKQQLIAIQWDTLSEDIERCAMYRIPPNHAALHKRLLAARTA